MNFSSDSDFEVAEVGRPGKKGRTMIYTFEHDSLTVTNIRRKNPRYIYHLKISGDSINHMRRHRMKYSIFEAHFERK